MNKLPWLKHDAQASNDSWLRSVVRNQGIGAGWVWWGLCEQLHTHGIGNKFTRNIADIAAYSCVKPKVLTRILEEFGRTFEGERRLFWKKNGQNLEIEIKNYRKLQEKFGRKTPSKPPENPPKTPTDKSRADKIRVDKKQLEIMFYEFWKAWPKKEDKQDAQKVFIGINPDRNLLDVIIKAITSKASSDSWMNEGGKFIPGPAKWLRGKRWEDVDDAQRAQDAKTRQAIKDPCLVCHTAAPAPNALFCLECSWCGQCDDQGRDPKKDPKDLKLNSEGRAICGDCNKSEEAK